MACYKSYIQYRVNTYPEEGICVGMVMIDKETGESRAKLSDLKLKIASKILPRNGVFKMFKYSVNQLINYNQITFDYLHWLNINHNGIIKITEPRVIACSLDHFDSLFENLIEKNFKPE